MNLTLPNVLMFVVGIVLMYAAVKNRDPRDIVREALRRPTATRTLTPAGTEGFGPA